MTIGRSGVITFAVFLVVFWLFVQAGQSGDLMWRGMEWAVILLLSSYLLVRLWRGRAHSTDYTIGLPRGLRRWLMVGSERP